MALAAAGLAALLTAATARPGGPWWCALLAAVLLWRSLAPDGGAGPRGRGAPDADGLPRLGPGPLGQAWRTGLALLPLPAYGYQGLWTLAPVAWLAMTVAVAALYALAGAAASCWLARGQRGPLPVAARPLGCCLAWWGLDLGLSHSAGAWLPAPAAMGYLMVDSPLAPLAALGGPAAVTVGWLVSAAALAMLPLGPLAPARFPKGALAWCLAATLCWLAAVVLQRSAEQVPLGPAVRLAVLQGLADEQALAATRVNPGTGEALLRAYLQATEALAAGQGSPVEPGQVDLHVWPETALGFSLADGPAALAAIAAQLGAPVLAGAYRRVSDLGTGTAPSAAPRWRNAAVLAEQGRARFVVEKRLLVPVYEGWLEAGLGELWPVRAAGLRWGVLICWESLYLDLALAQLRADAEALLVLIHDGWAGRTATPWWHARSGRLLALATGRPVVMASHDGPSMAWSQDGRLLASTEDGAPGMVVELRSPLGLTTPYTRWGPAAPWVAYALAWLAVGLGLARQRRLSRWG